MTRKKELAVTNAFAVIVVVGMMSLVGVGCANKKTDAPMSAGVTDVSAPTSYASGSTTAQPAYTPAPQPVIYDSTTTTSSSNSQASGGAATIGGGAYTVKKGDTLYSIARSRYGDGKQWQKIASANPGVRPETLKVGQTITLP
jgi:5'-nucleotidase